MNPKRRSPYSAKVMQLLREEFFLNVPDATEAHWRQGVETIRGTATEQWVKRLIEAHFRRVDDRSRGDDD